MNERQVKIKRIHTYGELKEIAAIRSELWPDDGEVALDHMKFNSQHGGIILGAYQEDQMVGYIYSFPGYRQNQVYLILQNIGVLPAYQHQKIGEDLMQRLKMEAQQLGYKEIIWTYEPLESVNAYFYLYKLGAVSSEYIKNCYEAEQNDLPIDRFLTRWDITDTKNKLSHTKEAIMEKSYRIPSQIGEITKELDLDITELQKYPYVLIPVPSHFQAFRSRTEVHGWRFFTRSVFCQLFQHGWEIFDLIKNENNDSAIHYYVARERIQD